MEGLSFVELEYETIVQEREHSVVFRVDGRQIEIQRGVLVDYDLQGRFYLAKEDLEQFGLKASS